VAVVLALALARNVLLYEITAKTNASPKFGGIWRWRETFCFMRLPPKQTIPRNLAVFGVGVKRFAL